MVVVCGVKSNGYSLAVHRRFRNRAVGRQRGPCSKTSCSWESNSMPSVSASSDAADVGRLSVMDDQTLWRQWITKVTSRGENRRTTIRIFIQAHSLKILFLIFHCSRHFNHSALTLAMSSGVGIKISAELDERNEASLASSVCNSVSSAVRWIGRSVVDGWHRRAVDSGTKMQKWVNTRGCSHFTTSGQVLIGARECFDSLVAVY